jgi:hypothetical protein
MILDARVVPLYGVDVVAKDRQNHDRAEQNQGDERETVTDEPPEGVRPEPALTTDDNFAFEAQVDRFCAFHCRFIRT